MKIENVKKGFFERLTGGIKNKKSSCCCNVEIEEIPEKNTNDTDSRDSSKPKKNSCC